MVESLTTAKNRLHALLAQQFPGYDQWFTDPALISALDFWHRFPSPAYLQRATLDHLATLLGRRIRGPLAYKKAEVILASVSGNRANGLEEKTRALLIQYTVSEIRELQRIIKGLEVQIERLLGKTGLHLTTIPGVNVVSAAGLVAEIGPITRFASADKLAAYAGIAPVERSSGQKRRHRRTRSGRRSLHKVLYHIALCQISVAPSGKPGNPKAREFFLRKIAEGKTKRAAMTCVMRRLVGIVYTMMKHGTPYRPDACIPRAVVTAAD
ncbi:MAG: IS110 family transposase [Bacillota bacterium]